MVTKEEIAALLACVVDGGLTVVKSNGDSEVVEIFDCSDKIKSPM